jgi:hypothetical protein
MGKYSNNSNQLDKYFYYIVANFILRGSKFFGERKHVFSKKKPVFTLHIYILPCGSKFYFT